jgi:hypothetical protein
MKHILIHCGNGYFFDECYLPVIKELHGHCKVSLLLENSFLTTKILKNVNLFIEDKILHDCHITELYTRSAIGNYLACKNLLKKLKTKKVDLFIIGDDYLPSSQYLITHFKSNGGETAIVKYGFFHMPIHAAYCRENGISMDSWADSFQVSNIRQKIKKLKTKNLTEIIRVGARYIYFRNKPGVYRKKINKFLGFKLIPYLTSGRGLMNCKYDFFVGLSNYVIVHDKLEYEEIKLLIPSAKKIFLAKHPSYDICKDSEQKRRNKLLVLVSSAINAEIPKEKMSWWIEVVQKINGIRKPVEIQLRFHPRESDILKRQFEKAFASKNIRTVTTNSIENSVVEGFSEFMGVVGSSSNALRFARAASREIFIIGLIEGALSGFYGGSFILGDSEGIHWLEKGDTFDKKYLEVPKLSLNKNPSIAEYLLQFLKNPEGV